MALELAEPCFPLAAHYHQLPSCHFVRNPSEAAYVSRFGVAYLLAFRMRILQLLASKDRPVVSYTGPMIISV